MDDGPFFKLAFLPIPVGVVGAGLWLWGGGEFPPVDAGALYLVALIFGAILFALWMGMSAYLLRRDRNRMARLGIVAVMAGFGWGMLGLGSVPTLNGAADTGPVRQRMIKIEDVTTGIRSHRRGGRSARTVYFAKVKSWRPGRQYESFEVSKWTADGFHTHNQPHSLVISTKPGLLGFEWLVDVGVNKKDE